MLYASYGADNNRLPQNRIISVFGVKKVTRF